MSKNEKKDKIKSLFGSADESSQEETDQNMNLIENSIKGEEKKIRIRNIESEKQKLWYHINHDYKREGPSAVTFHKFIYIFGGNDPFKIYDKKLHRFDTETLQWDTYQLKGNVLGRKCHSAVMYDKEIILLGGISEKSGQYIDEVATINIETLEYTPVDLTGEKFDIQRSKHAFGLAGNKMYILGGEKDQKKKYFDDFYEIDVSSKPYVVKSLPNMPKLLFSIRCIINSKSLIIFGGVNKAQKNVYEYKFDESIWVSRKVLPFGFRCSYSCQLLNEDVGLFYGGYNSNMKKYFNSIYQYDIPLDKWTQILNVGVAPIESAYSSATMVGNTFFVLGGYSGDQNYANDIFWMSFPPKINNQLFVLSQKYKIFDDISFSF